MKHVKIEIFIPREDSRKLIDKINEAGYLKEENYDYCYAETYVLGHFRPIEGANPYIGSLNKIEEVQESKLEFRIRREELEETMRIIKENHPYEVPVINVIELIDLD